MWQGNHELYNFTRAELDSMLGTSPTPSRASFYSFVPHPRLRCVILDPYDLNTIDNRESTPRHKQGYEWLSKFNKTDLHGRGTV